MTKGSTSSEPEQEEAIGEKQEKKQSGKVCGKTGTLRCSCIVMWINGVSFYIQMFVGKQDLNELDEKWEQWGDYSYLQVTRLNLEILFFANKFDLVIWVQSSIKLTRLKNSDRKFGGQSRNIHKKQKKKKIAIITDNG